MIHMTLKIATVFENVLPVLPIQFGKFFICFLEDCVQIGPVWKDGVINEAYRVTSIQTGWIIDRYTRLNSKYFGLVPPSIQQLW
jgi:hypothetical protein